MPAMQRIHFCLVSPRGQKALNLCELIFCEQVHTEYLCHLHYFHDDQNYPLFHANVDEWYPLNAHLTPEILCTQQIKEFLFPKPALSVEERFRPSLGHEVFLAYFPLCHSDVAICLSNFQ